MKIRLFVIGCLTGTLLGILISLTLQHSFRSVRTASSDGSGAASEWDSFSVYERTVYVEGYTAGYGIGGLAACDKADLLFETKGQLLPDGTLNNPVQLCHEARDRFTRMGSEGKVRANYSVYSDVITEFYNKYPKYKTAPFSFLLRLSMEVEQFPLVC